MVNLRWEIPQQSSDIEESVAVLRAGYPLSVDFVISDFCLSGVELCPAASSTCSLPVEESRQGIVQGEERLDHPSDQSVGEQQAGSRIPGPGRDVRLLHHGKMMR